MTSPSAAELDAADPLAAFRDEFELPDGVYLVGNSLGALPTAARTMLDAEVDRWRRLGVEGWFHGEPGWMEHDALVRPSLAGLVGARESEVVAMNSLTVNLHLLMVSFYRPTTDRHKILVEDHAFPSDHFAVESQIRQRGFDPADSLVTVAPRSGEETLRAEDLLDAIARHGNELALVLLPGVQYFTGQVLPMAAIAEAAHTAGATVGFDLAHAIGNIEMALHDWDVDFAAWCSYKYLNAGPGAIGGAFVHERHLTTDLPRLAGWWGSNPETRFEMSNEFEPIPTADGWQVSTMPVLAMATLRAALDVIDRAGGIGALRRKSERQIAYLDERLAESLDRRVRSLTPTSLDERGAQVALRVTNGDGRRVFDALDAASIRCDWREPDVIRAAPVPLYNSFADIDRFVTTLGEIVG